jgi:2-polyprenyl-3-methyl-5-hydroxy-6-metoxy-1,4-benzoquinol methylase
VAVGELQQRLYSTLQQKYPMLSRGVQEARAVAPDLVDEQFEECLRWAARAFGDGVIEDVAAGYAFFTLEVNRAQQAYEKDGRYKVSTFAEANALVYQQPEYMRHYYWGVFAILFCWPHYVELMDFYLNRFVAHLGGARLLEIAPGHGAWGLIAVMRASGMSLEGWDISPTSLEMAPKMALGAGVADRCTYRVADATKIEHDRERFDAAVCCFMLEHLEQPGDFLKGLAPALKSGGTAFITLALTAGQPDHIFEFHRESEGILLAEAAGLEMLECRIARPSRLLPNAKYVPRVQAMILRKP